MTTTEMHVMPFTGTTQAKFQLEGAAQRCVTLTALSHIAGTAVPNPEQSFLEKHRYKILAFGIASLVAIAVFGVLPHLGIVSATTAVHFIPLLESLSLLSLGSCLFFFPIENSEKKKQNTVPLPPLQVLLPLLDPAQQVADDLTHFQNTMQELLQNPSSPGLVNKMFNCLIQLDQSLRFLQNQNPGAYANFNSSEFGQDMYTYVSTPLGDIMLGVLIQNPSTKAITAYFTALAKDTAFGEVMNRDLTSEIEALQNM